MGVLRELCACVKTDIIASFELLQFL